MSIQRDPTRARRFIPIVLAAAGLTLAACTVGHGAPAAPSDAHSSTVVPAEPTPAPTSEPTAPVGPASAPPTCPVTRPDPAFHAPPPFPEVPPERYDSAWYGSEDLFAMLALDGEVWTDLPLDAHGFGQKSFWWSASFVELEPAIVVSGERLDAPGAFETAGLGTNASADFGRAMLIGIQIPAAGCWRLTGTYRGTSLSYVVWVGPLASE